MSLETKIETLTKAIEALTIALSKQANPVAVEPVEPVETNETTEATVTQKDIFDLCLELSRKEPKLKDPIKDIIKSYGAKTTKDINPKDYNAIHEELLSLGGYENA